MSTGTLENVILSHILAFILNNHTIVKKAFNLPRPHPPRLGNELSGFRYFTGLWFHALPGRSCPTIKEMHHLATSTGKC